MKTHKIIAISGEDSIKSTENKKKYIFDGK